MADYNNSLPTLQRLLEELKDANNWFVLGIFLGVPVKQLQKIESLHRGELERCKIDMLQYWLDNDVNASWKYVVRALEQTNQLVLAETVKQKYLLSDTADQGSIKQVEVNATSSALPSTSLLSPPPPPPPPPPLSSPPPPPNPAAAATANIGTEIKASITVVEELQALENSYSHTLVKVVRFLNTNCDLSEAQLFLDVATGTEEFSCCDNFDKLIRQLQRDQIDVFNISRLQELVACFNKDELTELVKLYEEKKDSFLKNTTVLDFQHAVVNRVKPDLHIGEVTVTIKIPKKMASCRTLKDIEELAMEGFEECYKSLVRLHAEAGSIIISWVFPEALSDKLEQLACKNVAIFKDAGVEEVTVGGRRVYPVTQQEGITTLTQDVSEEVKSTVKQVYTEFYHQLVDAVSDPHTCQSLTAQLHPTTPMAQEKIAQLSSGQTSGSEFLKVLGVEEEPHLLTMLMEKMARVKQLQTLAAQMTARLNELQQVPSQMSQYESTMSSTAKQNQKLRFEEIVDKFALRLTDDERERLVQLYDLPPIYFNKSRVQVFRALRMLGIYSHDNPEGLLDIGEVLQRRDIISDFREEIQTHAQNLRKLRHRKSSLLVDLQEIYSKFDLPPNLDLSMEGIEVLQANVRLLEKITSYRYNNDDFRRRRIKFHLENAWQKLTDVADCLALAGDEAISPTTVQLKAKPILESHPPAVDVSSHDHITVTEMKINPAPVFYENIGAGRLGRRGSDPLMTIKHSSVMESTSPKLRRESVPNQKPASPAPQLKLPHNVHSSHSDSTRSSEQAVGLESPRPTWKPGPMVKPKPTARAETRSVAQHTLKPPAPLPGETSDCSGSGDSGFADDSWPKPHPHPREEAFTAKLEHHYQQLVQSQQKDTFNADDDVYENPQPYKHK